MAKMTMKEQLGQLKALTERLGTLHEAQILQIRNYPLLIPGVVRAETNIDIDKKIVSYKCSSGEKKFRNTAKVALAIEKIYEFIKYVAWTDTILEIKINGKDIFDSRAPKT